MIMNISRREKTLLIAVLGAAVIVGVYMLFYLPLITRIEQKFALVESEQAGLQDVLIKDQENKAMLQEIAQIESDIAAVIGALPKVVDEPGLIIHLHHMFAPYGGINSVNIEDPAVNPEFSGVGVTLSFEGTYEAFNMLLKALEDSRYKNLLSSFTVGDVQTGNVGEGRTVTTNMALTFYFSN